MSDDKFRTRVAKKRSEDKQIAREKENEELARQKKIVFDAEFPAFNEKIVNINNEIISLETQIAELKRKKAHLQSKFENKCVHRFDDETSFTQGDYRWVFCKICGYKEGEVT